VADLVTEHSHRIPYFDVLHYLVRADALMMVGSDDSSYSASKIFPYLFSGRPVVTVAHEASLMFEYARQCTDTTYGFSGPADVDRIAASLCAEWFRAEGWRRAPSGNIEMLAQHTAAGMTAALARVFDHALKRGLGSV
jgi:hypothetical protein